MTSRKRGRKGKQQRLTFEPVTDAAGAGSSSFPLQGIGLSPANVRFSSPTKAHEASPSRDPSTKSVKMGRKGKAARQQTLEASMGNGKAKKKVKQPVSLSESDDEEPPMSLGSDVQILRRAAPSPPPSSFMRKPKNGCRRVVAVPSDSETPVEEDGGVTDSDGEGPLKQETPRLARTRPVVTFSSDSDDDQSSNGEDEIQVDSRSFQSLPNQAAADDDSDVDDQPLVTPRSSMPRRRGPQVADLDDEDEAEDEEIQTPAKRRRLARNRAVAVSPSLAGGDFDAAQSKPTGKRASSPPASTARSMRSGVRKGHRSEREKMREVLRRRKAGEKDLQMEDLTPTEDEDGEGALYDTDSDHQALEVFDDESEPEEVAPQKKSKKAKKRKAARHSSHLGEAADSDDENFIDDDDDTLGVPDDALHLIPLEFTRASRKPLKDHFRDAVEWLVHRKINPGFDKDNEVYTTAWRRLSDEVTGLANSKFVSSVWKPDFYKALKARPYIEQTELGMGDLASEFNNCQACGRSGHPATWSLSFKGKPYDSKTLDEVDSDSEEDEEDGDRDADGNLIPAEDKDFFVGATCNANAETAHSLIHWKPALRDWIEDRLGVEGWLAEDKVLAREKMKAKKRQKLADGIVEDWDAREVVKNLFGDFKRTLEMAREKDPAKVARRR